MVYIIVKRTGIKWKQGQISTTWEGDCFIEHQIIKTHNMRNVWQTEKLIWKSCEWKSQLISTQSLLYIINAYWQDLKTSMLLDAVLVNFNLMCWASWASKQGRNEKLKGQLEKGRLPLLMSRTSFCLVPTNRCHFARKKTKKNAITKHQPGRYSLLYEFVCSSHC